jgi:uncharacterized protein YwgA
MTQPIDWLLIYCAFQGAPDGLDPVRLQKGMFRFAEESDLPATELYDFEPYHYGPMSRAVYADIDTLESRGLVKGVPVEGYSWKRYRATSAGVERARELNRTANPAAAARLFDIKDEVAQQSFSQLLRDVYARYPAYATKSVFHG